MMKRKNTIVSLISIVIFISSLWTFIDWYKIRELKKWSKEQKMDINDECISSLDLDKIGVNPSQRADICDCYVESICDSLLPSDIVDLKNNWPDSLSNIQASLMEICMTPYADNIVRASKKADCLEEVIPRLGEEKAVLFCDCFVPHLIEKYGYQNAEILDSLDKEKAKECMGQD